MKLTINGKETEYAGAKDRPLLWYIREDLKLTGTKYGCGVAACGACTVLVDGVPTRSCSTPASAMEGRKITTIEGLDSKAGKAVQQAWTELDVVQCGWCQSGQILTAAALLTKTPKPTEQQITDGMTGNLCRCATYHRIRGAVARASEIMG
ncbi:MAG: 2Fe-2S iron-sulfur cluster binding domain-containing protein [Alphaproteobacteria bacterium]|nr:2Fe-2S iron-sulfur cluster binding domain-containing protein [Alphaproteobacteria bacterium]